MTTCRVIYMDPTRFSFKKISFSLGYWTKLLLVQWTNVIHKNGSLTYLLTQWSRLLLEKLTGFQLAKKFPAFYGT